MVEIDPVTGLPKELGAWDSITKENQKISISVEKKRFGKPYTIIEGFDEKEIDLKTVAKQLKNKLACGGTAKEGRIELQGDHKQRVKEELVKMGFGHEAIQIQ